MLKRLASLSAAALLAALPVFAHEEGKAKQEHGQCPHVQGASASVDRAAALLDQAAAAKDPAQADAKVAEARKQLAAAKKHMADCQEMCRKMSGGHAGHAAAPGQQAKVVDPVCGMKIDPATAADKSVHAGKTYYFCSKDEKAKFDKNPEPYLKKGNG